MNTNTDGIQVDIRTIFGPPASRILQTFEVVCPQIAQVAQVGP